MSKTAKAIYGVLSGIMVPIGIATFILFVVLLGSNSGSGMSYYEFRGDGGVVTELFRTKYCLETNSAKQCASISEALDSSRGQTPDLSGAFEKAKDVCVFLFAAIMVSCVAPFGACFVTAFGGNSGKAKLMLSHIYGAILSIVSATLCTLSYSYLANNIAGDFKDAGFETKEMGGLRILLAVIALLWISMAVCITQACLIFRFSDGELSDTMADKKYSLL